jgi:FMN-dependent oxidoreductase (nitrilotriacetate monooxygenase family)
MSLHLNLSLATPGHVRGAWLLEGNDPAAAYTPARYRELARLAAAARIDAVFVGDSPVLGPGIAHTPAIAFDPVVLFADVLSGLPGLGGIATASTTYNDPYNLARRFLTLDHLTGGRAGWNAVTTMAGGAAANFGLAAPPPRTERYRRAGEFLEVVHALWRGWEPDAIVADRGSGRYADPDRIHDPGHRGEFFAVAGALPVPASPQGAPVQVQAGASAGGLALAGRFAEVVFASAHTVEHARRLRAELRAQAAGHHRDSDSIVLSAGVVTIVGATEAQARARRDEVLDTIRYDDALAALATQLGVPYAALRLDEPVPAGLIPRDEGALGASAGFLASVRALLTERPLTARELIRRNAGGAGHRLLVGTPEQVADDLQAWYRAGAADGFTIMPAEVGDGYSAVTEHVVPELVRRGLFHADYRGPTLRENLGLPSIARAVAA